MKTLNPLARTAAGRILLHALCLLRHPEHFGWHLQGILRELAPAPRTISSRIPASLAILFVLATAMASHAQSFVDWHDSIVATLGRGVDPRNPDTIKPPVAVIDLSQSQAYSGTGEALFTVYFSQHQFDMIRHFALNASLSAKYGAYSGRVNFGMVDNTSYSGNTLNFVFVGNRDFGQTHYPIATLSPQFIADVNYYKGTGLRGDALGQAVEDRYGTHYYTGHKSAAKVVVIYTFTFESQTTARSITASLDAKYNGGVNSASFHTDVASYFDQSDSRVTLNYRFYSSDPIQLPDFPVTAAISNFTQFLEFTAKVENYCKGMDPARGKRTGYVVEEIKNLPGYLALLDGYNSADRFNTDYDRFLEAYGKLKQWDDTLSGWIIDPRRMSWMNTNGQRMVQAMRRDVANYRRSLEAAAQRHFATGEPLQVPEDIFNYFANFSRIPLPTINIVRNISIPLNNHLLVGYVNCGNPNLVEQSPFRSLTLLKDGIEFGASIDIYYSETNFTNNLRTVPAGWSSRTAEWLSGVNEFLASERWSMLRQDAQRCRIGFFIRPHPSETNFSFALKDAAGGIIDEVNWLQTPDDACPENHGAAVDADLNIGGMAHPTQAMVDSRMTYEYAVTNLSLNPTYGNIATLPIPAGMEVLAVSGSQGFGTVTDGQVLYEVGPLASGNSATIKLDLVPTRAGLLSAAPATVTLGDGLIDPNPANNTALTAPLTVSPPVLEIRKGTGYVDLSWISDTGRLVPQIAPRLIGPPTWITLTNGIATVDGRKTLRVPATAASRFFRLFGTSG